MAIPAPPPRRKTSATKAAGVTKPSIATKPSTRKRKVNPELRDRVESFLANANPPIDASTIPAPPKRRKVSNNKSPRNAQTPVIDLTSPDPEIQPVTRAPVNKAIKTSKGPKTDSAKKEQVEKRQRIFRKAPPQTYLQKLHRAQTQRMVVLDRKRVNEEAFPCESIELVGSTGNVYTVTIDLVPRCTCPDFMKGNQCKHIVYCLVTVLRAPTNLQYQLAFLSSELHEIFAHAPPIPTQVGSAHDTSGNRKPVEGECPICYMDFDEEHNELVWCRAACGNNMHKSCFDQWVASQRGSVVKCVYCRTPWQSHGGNMSEVAQQGVVGEDGYMNVAHLTGHSTARDVSTYHQPWVRRQYFGMGY